MTVVSAAFGVLTVVRAAIGVGTVVCTAFRDLSSRIAGRLTTVAPEFGFDQGSSRCTDCEIGLQRLNSSPGLDTNF